MGINFPNAPAVGELHPTPPVAGVPQYRWDGTAWVAQSQDQLAFVKRTGDTMSGALTLPADPAAALQAATKQYVDAKSSLYISDNPPVAPPDGSMWWDSDNGLLYIRYNDGAGPSQWVQAVATPAVDGSVFVNKAGDTMGGALTLPGDPAAALQAAPKQYVDAVRAYAAPYDAAAYSGMQINGSMEVSQERPSGDTVTPGVFKYGVDGFGTLLSSTAASAETGRATVLDLPGFTSRVYLNSAVSTLTPTGDAQTISALIEGYRTTRLAFGTANAMPVTVSFWVKPHVSGTMSVALRAGDLSRSYVVNISVTGAVWQYKTVTIPGDIIGTWNTTNGVGIYVVFCFGAGSALKTTAGVWTAGNFVATSATTNFFATTGTISLTGVTILPGTQAPTAAQSPMIMRPYDQELQTCQRYYAKLGGDPNTASNLGMNGSAYGASVAVGCWFNFPARMRSLPTVAKVGTWVANNCGQPIVWTITDTGCSLYVASVAAGAVSFYTSGASSYLTVDARL